MRIDTLTIKNIRAIADANLTFSKGINLLIGQNNAGKSTVLLPLLSLQKDLRSLSLNDRRIGTSETWAKISFSEQDIDLVPERFVGVRFERNGGGFQLYGKMDPDTGQHTVALFPNYAPDNFIYPFTSKRKVTTLSEVVNSETVVRVAANLENLNAKIDRLSNPEFQPAHNLYMKACQEILGFVVTAAHTRQGKKAVYTIRNADSIPLLSMGEGVMNILGIIVDLALAENKLFLIEEPENDIHPKALKALMDVVAESAKRNQFIITTHSNIVLKCLGAAKDARIFNVTSEMIDRLPTATVARVEDTPDARQAVLADLGYEMYDSDLWDAWLILEESSAERLIRQYFIPWFTPRLQGRLKTYAAHSISEVPAKFDSFNNLFVFLHLASVYKNKAWVVVDAGGDEKKVIEKLQSTYKAAGWDENQFLQFSQHDFENYLPEHFKDDVDATLGETEKQKKRAAKKLLLENVLAWIAEDVDIAKTEFEASAADVIQILKQIEAALS